MSLRRTRPNNKKTYVRCLSGAFYYDTSKTGAGSTKIAIKKKTKHRRVYPVAMNNFKGSGSSKLGRVPTGFEPVFECARSCDTQLSLEPFCILMDGPAVC